MKTTPILFLILILAFSQGCNTLYYSKIIDIEVMEPAKVLIPQQYKKVAVRYNNTNVSPHTYYGRSYINGNIAYDQINLDSIASKIYFDNFLTQLKKQDFFDTIIVLENAEYSNIFVKDTINYQLDGNIDSLFSLEGKRDEIGVKLLSLSINKEPNRISSFKDTIFLNNKLGLYQHTDLKTIADTANADLLLSLDFFSAIDGIHYIKNSSYAYETVGITGLWNFYDLKDARLKYFYKKQDTINWDAHVTYESQLDDLLPPTKDAVLNAADLAGNGFANFLIPHWSTVQRMYYYSGHVELKQTDKLVQEGRWLNAAEVWKKNLDNPNQKIVAKCMYNLAVACEMNGDLEAAMDWVVRSFYSLENKNETHADNCTQYIKILAQRKVDFKKLENQFTNEIN